MQRKTVKEFRNDFTRLYKAKEPIEIYFTNRETGEVLPVGIFTPNMDFEVLPNKKASAPKEKAVLPAKESQEIKEESKEDEKIVVLPSLGESAPVKEYETCKEKDCHAIAINNGKCFIHATA